jgi:hypothetical protein
MILAQTQTNKTAINTKNTALDGENIEIRLGILFEIKKAFH